METETVGHPEARAARPVGVLPTWPAGAWEWEGRLAARPYQRRQVEKVWRALSVADSTLVVSATGTGKTVMFGHLCRVALKAGIRRILVLAHRDELISQAHAKIQEIIRPDGRVVEIEQGNYYADRRSRAQREFGESAGARSHVVVASKDSMCQEYRLASFADDEFDLVIVDEAHHCVLCNGTYWSIISKFKGAWLVGVTATPDRSDELALGQTFSSVASVYGMSDAINDGYLVPIMQQYITIDEYDLSRVNTSRNGDLSESGLARRISDEKVLHGIIDPVVKLSNTKNKWGSARPTLVFAPSVPTARKMAEIFNRRHEKDGTGSAACVSNEDMDRDERRAVIERYRSGEIRFLVNYGILTEGFDAPETRIVVIARATKSRALYEQMIGRGTRPHDDIVALINASRSAEERRAIIHASNKPSILVVDPVGNAGRHKLVNVADVLGGRYTDEVVTEAKKSIATGGGRGDVSAELAAAKKRLEEQERRLRAGIVIHVKYTQRVVDPFDVLDVPAGREPAHFKGHRPSEKQVEFLRRSGVSAEAIEKLTKHKASRLIDDIMSRRKDGLCTYGQAKVLVRYGLNPRMPFESARFVLDQLAAAGWPPPADFDITTIRMPEPKDVETEEEA